MGDTTLFEIDQKTILIDVNYRDNAGSVVHFTPAIYISIEIMRAFVRLRQLLASNDGLARKLEALEKKYDTQFNVVFDAIRKLIAPPEPKKRKIGFRLVERAARYGKR